MSISFDIISIKFISFLSNMILFKQKNFPNPIYGFKEVSIYIITYIIYLIANFSTARIKIAPTINAPTELIIVPEV